MDTSGVAYDANAAAKTAGATPFKRPENGVFRPGSRFGQFFFTVTGDTNTTSDANAGYGGWGALMQLTQADPGSDHGRLQVFYRGDQEHTGLDNTTFIDGHHLASVEGDDEITGIHMSDGDPTPAGILGAKLPRPFSDGWRLFWTQQHGQNITWEILPANR